MTLPGSDVGSAYIRIVADGSRLKESIRDEFRKAAPEFNRAGEQHARAYNEGAEDEWRKRPLWAEAVRSMQSGHGKFDATMDFLGSEAAKHLRDSLRKELSRNGEDVGGNEIADRIWRGINDRAISGGGLASVKADLGRIQKLIAQATKDIQRDEETARKEDERHQEEYQNLWERLLSERSRKQVENLAYLASVRSRYMSEAQTEAKRENDRRIKLEQSTNRDLERLLQQRLKHTSDINSSAAKRDAARMRALFGGAVHDLVNGDRTAFEGLRSGMVRFNNDAERGLIKLAGGSKGSFRELGKLESKFTDIDNKIKKSDWGNLFGEGSRNNFINFIGNVTGGLARMAALGVIGPIKGITSLGGALKHAAEEGDGFFDKANSIGDLLSGVFVKAVGVAVGAIGGLFALGNLAALIGGPIAAAISMLTGLLLALGSAAAFGIVGWLGAALPLLAPLAGGLGLAIAGIKGMDAATKTLVKNDLGKLKTAIKGIGEDLDKGWFKNLGKQVDQVLPVITKKLKPLAKAVGNSFGQVDGFIASALSGGAFAKFLKSMTTFMPHAISKLGAAGVNAFTGLTGLIRALVPWADKLLDRIAKTADKFSDFTNSKNGQNQIASFMDRAWQSALKLWTTVKDLGKIIGTLFSGGQATGNSLLDSMNSLLERFEKWLKSPNGQKAMSAFFAEVKTFAGYLGKAVGGIAKLFDSLDSSNARGLLNVLLGAIGSVGTNLSTIVNSANDFQKALGQALAPLVPMVGNLVTTVVRLADELGRGLVPVVKNVVAPVVGALIQGLSDLADWMRNNRGAAKALVGAIAGLWVAFRGYKIITSASTGIAKFFNFINSTILRRTAMTEEQVKASAARINSALAGLALGAVAGSVIGSKVSGTKGKLAGALSGAALGAAAGSFAGPWGAAIGGVAGGISGLASAWFAQGNAAKEASQKAQDALAAEKQAIDTVAQAFRDDNYRIGENTRLLVANNLQKSGALAAAQKLGVNLKTLTDAALGNSAAQTKVHGSIDKYIAAMQQSYLTGIPLTKQQQQMFGLASKVAAAMGDQANQVGKATRSANQVADAVGGATMRFKDNQEQIQSNITELHQMQVSLDQIGKTKTTPKIKLETVALQHQITSSERALNKLNNMKPTPKVTAKIDALTLAIQKAKEKLQSLRDRTVNIGADDTDAITAIRRVGNELLRLHGRTIAIKTVYTSTGKVTMQAAGGPITGPGTGTSDSIWAKLSNGEYVINAKQAAKYRHLLDAINNGTRGFASGGRVSLGSAMHISPGGSAGREGAVLFQAADMFGKEIITQIHRIGSAFNVVTESVRASTRAVAAQAARQVNSAIKLAVHQDPTTTAGWQRLLAGTTGTALKTTETADIGAKNLKALTDKADALDKVTKAAKANYTELSRRATVASHEATAAASSTKAEKANKKALEDRAHAMRLTADAAKKVADADQKASDNADKLAQHASTVAAKLTATAQAAQQAAAAAAQGLVASVQDAVNNLTQEITDFKTSVTTSFTSAADLGSMWDSMTQSANGLASAITGDLDLGNAWATTLQNMQDAASAAGDSVDGLTSSATASQTAMQALLSSFANQVAAASNFASDLGALVNKGLSKTLVEQISAQGPLIGDQLAQAIIQGGPAVIAQLNDLGKQAGDALNNSVNQAGIEPTAQDLQDMLNNVLTQSQSFSSDLEALSKLGASQDLLQYLIGLGPNEGDQLAKALSQGGAAAVHQLSSTLGSIQSIGNNTAQALAQTYYQGGVNMILKLIQGLESQFPALANVLQGLAGELAGTIGETAPAMPYVIRKGDTLGDVAAALGIKGTGEAAYQALRAANPILAKIFGNATSVSQFAGATIFKPPGFASGVTNFEGGLAYVHKNELLANLPKGTSVYRPDQLVNNGRTTNIAEGAIVVNTPTKDPLAVAQEVLNKTLAVGAY